ncbi:hypothetical protein HDZ31DRAFT_69302, partial [Schizophyllum fasciatum]
LLEGNGLPVYWTTLWRNSYSALFKPVPPPSAPTTEAPPRARDVPAAGPDAPDAKPSAAANAVVSGTTSSDAAATVTPDASAATSPDASATATTDTSPAPAPPLAFKWSPVMEGIIRPDLATVPEGTDAWAIHRGYASVTPLHAAFAEPAGNGGMALEDRVWRW